jgi:uncharacterized membrane protein YkvA (DUF1232 family)
LSLGATARAIAAFLPDCAVLLKRLVGDERVPRRAKVLLALLIPYLASPIDLIPDFIPVLGQLDDAVLVALVLRRVVRVAGRDVVEDLWPGSPRGLKVILSLASG